ncbi:MAG: sigma-70 family RNA polymerase sigma factor [Planctomycetaceae bacterium]
MEDVTRILNRIVSGDGLATEQLLPLVYDELRGLASRFLHDERAEHTLQPTALVHEAYVRLVHGETEQAWNHRGHFFAAAAEAMRRILVEHARSRQTLKRGGSAGRRHIELTEVVRPERRDDLVALDEALTKLERTDPRKATLVKLRYFAGLTMEQAAESLGISVATAGREWAYSRAWLLRELTDDG